MESIQTCLASSLVLLTKRYCINFFVLYLSLLSEILSKPKWTRITRWSTRYVPQVFFVSTHRRTNSKLVTVLILAITVSFSLIIVIIFLERFMASVYVLLA